MASNNENQLDTIVSYIDKLSLSEVSSLTERLQEQFGITASDLVGSAPVANVEKVEEKKSTVLEAIGFDPSKKIKAIKTIKKILSDCGQGSSIKDAVATYNKCGTGFTFDFVHDDKKDEVKSALEEAGIQFAK